MNDAITVTDNFATQVILFSILATMIPFWLIYNMTIRKVFIFWGFTKVVPQPLDQEINLEYSPSASMDGLLRKLSSKIGQCN
jgi:hypothetical protein